MTTVAPSKVKEFSTTSLERIAYKSVATIPTREPNDQYRLGYCIWKFLSERKGTLEEAIHTAGARILIPEAEVIRIVKESLKEQGVAL
ncbi:MAG: hypothetical protein KGJ59_04675 [Bacteroidota bacterium]|nr:hypothetical protein [Bacteroidota bacterium]